MLDGAHLFAAGRYVERNPVRAGLCAQPWDYAWSSAAAHLTGQDDELVSVKPLLDMAGSWREYVSEAPTEKEVAALRRHERTGRPIGNEAFIRDHEILLRRQLTPQKPGPKPTAEDRATKALFEN